MIMRPSGTIGLYGSNRYLKKNLAPSVNEYVRLFLLNQFSSKYDKRRSKGLYDHRLAQAITSQICCGVGYQETPGTNCG